jgi:hypothetical protein
MVLYIPQKTIVQAKSNHKYGLGKSSPKIDSRTLKFSTYASALATPPTSCDWTTAVKAWALYDNDSIGDCGPAGCGNITRCWSKNEFGTSTILTTKQIIKFYSALSGYNANTGANDDGVVMLDMMNRWRKKGVGGHKIYAYVSVDCTNSTEIYNSIYLFGGVMLGLDMPTSAQNQTTWDVPSTGTTGDGAPGSWGGHCVPCLAYDSSTSIYTVVSWGAIYYMTANFLATYGDEGYTPLSTQDWVRSSHVAPNGFSLATLKSDLELIATSA